MDRQRTPDSCASRSPSKGRSFSKNSFSQATSSLVVEAALAVSQEAAPLPLTPYQEAQLSKLEDKLKKCPESLITPHRQERRENRLKRWLRSEAYDADRTFQKLHDYCKWWKEYGMDKFGPCDELDEQAPLFVCGEDRWQGPLLVARPCVHFPANHQESMLCAKQCSYTLQRWVERFPPGMERATVLYDAKGLCIGNLDLAFARELCHVIENRFPGRVTRIIVINNHWTMSFFWQAISVLLDAETKRRILFLGTDFEDSLSHFLEADHPYFAYAVSTKRSLDAGGAKVPLPKSSPYVPRWTDYDAAESTRSSSRCPTSNSLQEPSKGSSSGSDDSPSSRDSSRKSTSNAHSPSSSAPGLSIPSNSTRPQPSTTIWWL